MNTIKRVHELGKERNLNLFRISVICDIPYPTLKNASRRKTQLSVDTIERICCGLGITMSDFFAEEQAQAPESERSK